ncbi:MAG TPA: ferredoxin [Kineosporiaceae bacterium]
MSGHVGQLVVDRDLCIGAGLCVLTAPDVFDQDDDGLVVVLARDGADPGAGPHTDAVREATRRCPSGALTWQE